MQTSDQITRLRQDAVDIYHAGLRAVDPALAVKNCCRIDGGRLFVGDALFDLAEFDDIVVVGAGKASALMGGAIEEIIGDRITAGVINVKYNHSVPLARIRLVEAGHPLPDENGVSGALDILNLLHKAHARTLVLCLISGGGSALLPVPARTLTLAHKQETTRRLLDCGAAIHDINIIRKHLSGIKGGQLCRAAYPGTVVSLILSDVVGDDLDVIASGPTVADTSTFAQCLAVLKRYNLLSTVPAAVVRHIQAGAAGRIDETPKADDPMFKRAYHTIVGNNIQAVLAARKRAEALGYHAVILSSMIQGETREVAGVHAAIAGEIIASGNPVPCPACVVSGGETTVTIQGTGRGGRNQEFALAAALGIAEMETVVLLSGGTDGTDGPTEAAGAIADSRTVIRAERAGLNPLSALKNNDAYPFFKKLGDLFITGPTGTNVMDLRILMVGAP